MISNKNFLLKFFMRKGEDINQGKTSTSTSSQKLVLHYQTLFPSSQISVKWSIHLLNKSCICWCKSPVIIRMAFREPIGPVTLSMRRPVKYWFNKWVAVSFCNKNNTNKTMNVYFYAAKLSAGTESIFLSIYWYKFFSQWK